MSQLPLATRMAAWTFRQLNRRAPPMASNPYLEGPYAPVSEERVERALRVSGALPPGLDGIYARIGPNPLQVANPGAYHWFVGDGMVHAVRLHDGQALEYRNRWVNTDSVARAFGRQTAPGPRHGLFDVVNTNVIGHAGRLWALVEAGPVPVALDGDLNTLNHGLFETGNVGAYSAHPHRDPATGELHAICYDAMVRDRVQHVAVDARGRLIRRVDIPVRHGPMIHDCALTANHVLVLDLPVTFSTRELLRGSPLPYRWNPDHPARVGLLPRAGSVANLRWFDVDPCFVFHPCNAFECEDGSVVVDVVAHARMFDRSHVGPELDGAGTTFERWTLPAGGTRVERRVLSDVRQEFPRCDERLATQPYRYAYTVGFGGDPQAPQPLLRHDLHDGTTRSRFLGQRSIPGEAVFVPRHAGAAEDDGWLLTLAYDLDSGTSDLYVINAGDFEGDPQAVVHLPLRVPAGFHGNWIADPA